MVEAAFALLMFLGFMFLLVDVCWAMFAKTTLQHAVRSAVRYAVTSPNDGNVAKLGELAVIKQRVQRESMGMLSASDLDSYVTVQFFPVGSSTALSVSDSTANTAGNLVVISVTKWPLHLLAPLLHNTPVTITVSSGDLIETIGNGVTPPPLLPPT